MSEIRISLLHLALKPGDLPDNFALVERGVRIAAASGTDWVVAPELCLSGYQFIDVIGTDWVVVHPDEWTVRIGELARLFKLAILFGHVERDDAGKLYNGAFLIDSGAMIGHHRKINTHAEPWATSGASMDPVDWNGLRFGILICSDAYTGEVAGALKSKGAKLLVSAAAWAPGLYGPEGEWEQRTVDTGLPLVVCNRTGEEKTLTFYGAESLVIKNGHRLLSHSSRRSAVLSFGWNLEQMLPTSREFEIIYL